MARDNRDRQAQHAERAKRAAATRAERSQRAAELAEAKGDRAVRKAEQFAEKLAQKAKKGADNLDKLASRLDTLEVWLRDEPRSRRPRFSRDQIAEAAVRVADAEGFAALSMRRLAAELEAGTMTLYHYIRTKDELLTLVTDAVMGEVVVPEDIPIPEDWREALLLVADRSRAALLRHPWTMDIADDPPLGPNSVRHFDQTLQAVASLDIPLADKLDIVLAVDEYVFGFCQKMRENRDLGEDDEPATFDENMVDYVNGLVASGEYPQLAELAEHHGYDELWASVAANMRDKDRFATNLRRFLDGIEADLPRLRGR